MKVPFVPRGQHDAVLADRERIRGERDQFAKDRDAARTAEKAAARKFAEADATNIRLTGRIDELTNRLDARPVFEESSALRSRIRHLEKQLDDAVGLTPGRPKNSGPWQPGYEAPKPDTKASAS